MADVRIYLYKPLILRMDVDNLDYLETMRDEFTRFAPNYRFNPKFKAGYWNGKISMIDKFRSTFPYGLLMDFLRVHKRIFPRFSLEIDPKVKKLFAGPEFPVEYPFSDTPRPYQKDCIEAGLRYTKGIIRSATASGKSYVIACIIHNLLQQNLIDKSIIIVPTKGLIAQFYQNLIEDYGFDTKDVGMVFAESKQWDRQTIISTWQSLVKNLKKLKDFGCVMVDETHGAKAHDISKILKNATSANYRLGFTGTMHSNDLDNWNTKAYLGPVIREYPAGLLAEQGWISKCVVNICHMNYKGEIIGDYNDIRDQLFTNEYRLDFINKLVNKLDHNSLILVHKVEKEGEFLRQYLKTDKEVVFLSGKDDVKLREHWRKECMKRDDIILIATYGIFQMGINIPNLKYVIFGAPFKAKIRILQSIGRALRKHEIKEESGAHIFDIQDHTKFFEKHGDIRLRHYNSENFEVREFDFYEGSSSSLKNLLAYDNSK